MRKCKTFADFFYLYTDYDDISELDQSDYDSYDYGYDFNQDGASLNDFKKWFEEVKDNKIIAIKPNDKRGTITFKMNNEVFDLDFVGDE